MMDRGTVRNMLNFIPKSNFENVSAASWFYYKNQSSIMSAHFLISIRNLVLNEL